MIKPTVGRVVWFWRWSSAGVHSGPLAAHVCWVHSDRCVNLMVIGGNGTPFSQSSVQLVQEGDEKPAANYCEWMPYQKAVAKHEGG